MKLIAVIISKKDNSQFVEEINQDYHNGDCEFIFQSKDLKLMIESLEYLVADINDHLLIISKNLSIVDKLTRIQ